MGGGGRVYAAARRHSSFVRALRIVIPAIALMAVLVVGALMVFDPFGRIPGLTVGPISFAGSKIAMERPKLTGFRKDNRAYEVTATAAFQDIRNPNVIELKELNARLATDEAGGTARLVAQEGVFDTGKEHLELRRDIRIWTEKGEEVLMRSASVDFKAGTAVSSEPVQVRTPTMQLDAATLDAADGGKVMAFVGRVHVTIVPGGQGSAAATADQPASPAAMPRLVPDDGPKVVDASLVSPVATVPMVVAAPSPAPPRPIDLRSGPSRQAEPRSSEPRSTARGGSSRETPPRYTQAEPPRP